MVDQEPQRSVQLIRRIDTRVPSPLLSATAGLTSGVGGLTAPGTGLGKLATDMRPGARPAAPIPVSARPAAGGGVGLGRGWTAVVNKPAAQPAPASTAAGPSRRTPGPPRTASPAAAVPAAPAAASVTVDDVPDNWEDDVGE
jgi:transcriptional repressor NF-X1